MRRIRIQNPIIEKTYRTFLGADYTAGGVTLTVVNTASFATNDIGLVGEPREEKTELKKINSLTGSTVFNLPTGLSFDHSKGTSVYKILWDFVEIEGRSSSAGAWAVLTQSGLQWDNKNNETVYYHSSGVDAWEYRFRFYNSITATYSEYSPTLTGAGFNEFQVGRMIENVRLTTGDLQRQIVSDGEIMRFLNRAQTIIYAKNPRYWFLLIDTYKGANGITCTAGNNVYSLASYTTLGHLDSIRFRYTNGSITDTIYHLEKKGTIEFDKLTEDLLADTEDWLEAYKLLPADSSSSKGYIQVYPTFKGSVTGTLYPNYYERMANLDTVDDETQVPIPSILEDFVIAQVEKIKGNETKAALYEAAFYGPADKREQYEKLTGIPLLDELDKAQKSAQAQPKYLWQFRGRLGADRYYGNKRVSTDYEKEFYMD